MSGMSGVCKMNYIHHPPTNTYLMTMDKPLPNEREISFMEYYENSHREHQASKLKEEKQ